MVNDMENKNKVNRKQVLNYVLIMLSIIISCAGLTYAFFTISTQNNAAVKTKVVSTDRATVDFLTSNSLNLQATDPGAEASVVFSVNLTGSTKSSTHTSYSINWNVTEDTFVSLSQPDLVYSIYSSDDGTNWSEVSGKQNINAKTLNIGDNKIVSNQSLDAEAGGSKTKFWKIKLQYLSLSSVDQSANQNKSFSGTITITDVD